MIMGAFVKTLQSYTMTALISMIAATSILALVAAIHKLFVSAGVSGTSVEISSFILGFMVLLVLLSVLVSIEALSPYLGRTLHIEYHTKLKKRKKKKKKTKTKTLESIGRLSFAPGKLFALLEHSLFSLTLAVVLIFSLVRLMCLTFVATFMERDNKG